METCVWLEMDEEETSDLRNRLDTLINVVGKTCRVNESSPTSYLPHYLLAGVLNEKSYATLFAT
jgi:hypothetical protein